MTELIARVLAWTWRLLNPPKSTGRHAPKRGKHAARPTPVDNTQPIPDAHDVTNEAHEPAAELARPARPTWWPPLPSAFEPVWNDEYNVRPFVAVLPPDRKLDPEEERRQEQRRQAERRAALNEASILPVGSWSPAGVFA
ncbi:hypothetical protein [Streptomyces sp. SID3343]|uniref:hypothetical protein n=1 Tax=Streptomyces sp. SID3343 TaxID=2690260 RepID=UPI00136AFB3D|nr:hypothetical protein [Streptomyces sp. SID3343]MYW05772.1 hypothetical protein [Streptomyces sp. SID3343]